jgi:hypothetical protein
MSSTISVPTRMGSGRMTIRKFDAIIHITSPTSVRTKIVANINPNISFLPNSLLEFCMKHLASVILSKLQNAAKKASSHPVTNPHAMKMREEKEFYQTWLLAKFQAVCTARNWEMPPIAAFNLSDEELHKAQRLRGNTRYGRAQTFSADNRTEISSYDDDIVENLLALQESPRDASEHNDALSMSALSSDTGRISIWSNNPITSYLRETERKVQQRKAEEEANARQIAVERLIPRERSFNEEERLNELKMAKYRRMDLTATNGALPDAILGRDVNGGVRASKSFSQTMAYQLYNHSPRTRYCIVLTLVIILLLMLQSGVLVKNSKLLSTHQSLPWYLNRSKDLGIIIYIFLCTIPHFLLVNVSLVYAFDALDIGFKSGGRAKTYYSDNVNVASLLVSFGIAFSSISLAMTKSIVRTLIWSYVRLWSFLGVRVFEPSKVLLKSIQLLPEEKLNFLVTSMTSVVTVVKYSINQTVFVVRVVAGLIWRFVFQSNFVGRGIANILTTGLSGCKTAVAEINVFIAYSIKSFDGEVTITSWRVEAFTTARFLFMNTAVFLLVTLSLFYLSSRKPDSSPAIKKSENVCTLSHAKSDISAISEDSDNPLPSRQRQEIYATIPEGQVAEHDAVHASFAPDDSKSGDAPTKRLRFRLRQRKAPNSNTGRKPISRASSSPTIGTKKGRKTISKVVPVLDRDLITHSKTM